MSSLGIRGKLLGVSFLLIAGAFFLLDAYLTRVIPPQIEARVEADLLREAELLSALAGDIPREDLDAFADKIGQALSARVTVIDREGRVWGDSELPASRLAETESHKHRPEIQRALREGRGVASRESRTLGQSLLYAAVPFPKEGPPRGVVRVALPLSDAERELRRARLLLTLGTVVAAIVALALSTTAVYLTGRSLRTLIPVARAMSEGDFSRRAPVKGRDEISELARSLNRLAADLEASWGAVRAERDLLKAVLEGMDEGVMVVDQDGRIARTNATLRGWLGLGREMKGRRPIEVWRDADLDEAIASVLAGGEAVRLSLSLPGPRERSLLGRVGSLSSARGTGAVVVFHDVTELRRLERVRRDFVANVSHELRTPVSAIQGAAETLLEEGLTTEDTRRFVEVINRHARRLGLLLSDLLELSRLESSAEPLDAGEVDIARSVEETLSQLSERLSARKLTTRIDIPPDLPRAAGESRALARVVGNLVENAINYTEPGGMIRFSARATPERVILEVSDTGVGIEAHHLPRIFERFYRADAGRSRAQGGTGLGLAIVKHLVQAMGGDVSVESAPGKGSTFRVALRRA